MMLDSVLLSQPFFLLKIDNVGAASKNVMAGHVKNYMVIRG
jgi:hypothetical protein